MKILSALINKVLNINVTFIVSRIFNVCFNEITFAIGINPTPWRLLTFMTRTQRIPRLRTTICRSHKVFRLVEFEQYNTTNSYP